MADLSGNSCNIVTLLPLGIDCDTINASTPDSSNGYMAILITGGTGSFGKNFINYLLRKKFPFARIIIFSRDEFKQDQLQKELDCKNNELNSIIKD